MKTLPKSVMALVMAKGNEPGESCAAVLSEGVAAQMETLVTTQMEWILWSIMKVEEAIPVAVYHCKECHCR